MEHILAEEAHTRAASIQPTLTSFAERKPIPTVAPLPREANPERIGAALVPVQSQLSKELRQARSRAAKNDFTDRLL